MIALPPAPSVEHVNKRHLTSTTIAAPLPLPLQEEVRAAQVLARTAQAGGAEWEERALEADELQRELDATTSLLQR
jgi:hypothetical protein